MAEPERPPILITPDMLVPAAAPDPHAGRIDFERRMSYAPPITLGLLAILLIVFVWQIASGALTSEAGIVNAGALVRSRVLAGEWWRLASATFLHGGPDHLIGNSISLYILGMACEHAFGRDRFAGIYAASGLAGSVLSMMISHGPSVGASGAIFGIMGALIAHLIKHQNEFYLRDKRIGIVLLAWAVYTLLIGFVTPYVDNGAHLGGLLAGIVAGVLVPSRLLSPTSARPNT
ncbi:MAG: rhomboid family intramembrane serine protease [Longimicrobiales bacterium]